MVDCGFCGTNIEVGTGLLYVFKNGKFVNFCSRKCEKNQIQLQRKARETPWTKAYKEAKDQRKKAK